MSRYGFDEISMIGDPSTDFWAQSLLDSPADEVMPTAKSFELELCLNAIIEVTGELGHKYMREEKTEEDKKLYELCLDRFEYLYGTMKEEGVLSTSETPTNVKGQYSDKTKTYFKGKIDTIVNNMIFMQDQGVTFDFEVEHSSPTLAQLVRQKKQPKITKGFLGRFKIGH